MSGKGDRRRDFLNLWSRKRRLRGMWKPALPNPEEERPALRFTVAKINNLGLFRAIQGKKAAIRRRIIIVCK